MPRENPRRAALTDLRLPAVSPPARADLTGSPAGDPRDTAPSGSSSHRPLAARCQQPGTGVPEARPAHSPAHRPHQRADRYPGSCRPGSAVFAGTQSQDRLFTIRQKNRTDRFCPGGHGGSTPAAALRPGCVPEWRTRHGHADYRAGASPTNDGPPVPSMGGLTCKLAAADQRQGGHCATHEQRAAMTQRDFYLAAYDVAAPRRSEPRWHWCAAAYWRAVGTGSSWPFRAP